MAATQQQPAQQTKQKAPEEVSVRVIEKRLEGTALLIEITVPRQVRGKVVPLRQVYAIDFIPSSWGRGFRLSKLGKDGEYSNAYRVCIVDPSDKEHHCYCDCGDETFHASGRPECKHIGALRALLKAEKI